MRKDDRVSYVMLFCALMLVRKSRATLDELVNVLPLDGRAKDLAAELTDSASDFPSET